MLSDYRVNGEWFVKSECIKSLITQIVEGKITTVEATNNYVSNYEVVTTVVTTTTTNTDTDSKELNPTHNARVRERAPTSESNGTPSQTTEPEYLDGMSEPIGKFPMTDGWHPSPDFRRRAALWEWLCLSRNLHQLNLQPSGTTGQRRGKCSRRFSGSRNSPVT